MKGKTNLILIFSHAFVGIGFFFIYVHHVRTVFERRTNFEHLSKIGRETLLRKEDALYFSFYKTIVDESDFQQGYQKLLNITTIEYPSSINVVKRFHVLPELVIGYLYHQFKDFSRKLDIPTVSCWTIERNSGRDSVISCEGLGEQFHFYLEFVWLLGGFTVFVLYMYSSFLSENSFGGIYAVVLYTIFHKNASKIYERPMARENFSFPFIFWQMFYLSLCIERASRTSYDPIRIRLFMITKLTILTTISLLCWQFSSVIFATQILIMIAPWSLGILSNWFCIDYAISQFLSNIIAYYITYENKKFILSWQNGPALALLCVSFAKMYKNRRRQEIQLNSIKDITLGIIMAFSSQGTITDILEKSGYIKPDDNPYSVYRDLVLHWGLQRKTNFSTSLLACNSDFAEIQIDDFWELIKTLFVKPYCLLGVVLLAKFLRKWSIMDLIGNSKEKIERAKNYALEDFLEDNKISMKEMANKETENDLNECYQLLANCNYNYEKYKKEKNKRKKDITNEHDDFINDIKKLKNQITENEKNKERTDNNIKIDQIDRSQEPEMANENKSEIKTDTKESKIELNQPKVNGKNGIISEFGFHYLYSVAQLVLFSFLGFSIRKLFFLCFTQGCLIAPTLCSKFWYKKQNNIFWTISLVVFFTSIVDPGLQNLENEYFPAPSNNDELETMMEWINMNTEKNAVFGGPIEIIGTVHLATRRPIVNHPHLEMLQTSDRTESIYSVFSRQQSSEIYNQCSQLKIQYLILSFQDCSNATDDECDILAIWDEMQPLHRKYPQFCSELINKNIPSFLKVYSNKNYGIIKMFSQSVQLNLKYNKMPERGM